MNWDQAWLTYHRVDQYKDSCYFAQIRVCGEGPVIDNAVSECKRGVAAMLGIDMEEEHKEICEESNNGSHGIWLLIRKGGLAGETGLTPKSSLTKEGYRLQDQNGWIVVEAEGEAGILYGVYDLLRRVAQGIGIEGIAVTEQPVQPLRMLNHWDNTDGSIERGYAGNSIFFENGQILVNERTRDYARLAASIGINGVVINNVNVRAQAVDFITEPYFEKIRELKELLEGYGIQLYLSLDFAAPMDVGHLTSADPLDPQVIGWWERQMKLVYENLPGFGGFLVKADSEGRPGPFTYGRNQADGANVLARAVKPYGGRIIWRCFVYNCQQDWRDKKTDRAKAAYEYFMPLDGKFDENVILQIKNGPIDFQVREPISPLFGKLSQTNQMLELQITQEYTGQQKHLCYLIPMYKEVLDFDTHTKALNRQTGAGSCVKDLVSGQTFQQSNCGMAAVSNVGNDDNWTGHDLAAANFYGFGRLAWNSELSAEAIAEEWIRMSLSNDPVVIETVLEILMHSREIYEQYTAPLGVGFMVNPGHHYGPNVDGYEYDRWGTYHRADHLGIGPDRSSTGTGYSLLYEEELAAEYDRVETCPDELLLFFHHVPYTHVLHSGKTVIQHIYDSHFEGADRAEAMAGKWLSLEGKLEAAVYERTKERFAIQTMHSREWRDQINTYFYRKSMITDHNNRKIYE